MSTTTDRDTRVKLPVMFYNHVKPVGVVVSENTRTVTIDVNAQELEDITNEAFDCKDNPAYPDKARNAATKAHQAIKDAQPAPAPKADKPKAKPKAKAKGDGPGRGYPASGKRKARYIATDEDLKAAKAAIKKGAPRGTKMVRYGKRYGSCGAAVSASVRYSAKDNMPGRVYRPVGPINDGFYLDVITPNKKGGDAKKK